MRRASWVCICCLLAACAAPEGTPNPSPREVTDPFSDVTVAVGLKHAHFSGMTGERYIVEVMGPGAGMADLDGDGDLDLLVRQGRLLQDGTTLEDALALPADGWQPGETVLRSDWVAGNPGLRLVNRQIGLSLSDYGFGVATGDFDRDGYEDLYLTALGPNRLLRGLGDLTFDEVTAAAGVGDSRVGTAATFFDYDRDGWLDLYVGNYVNFSLATHKDCFGTNTAVDYCGPSSYEPEPDRLFRNRGDGTFEDVSAAAGPGLVHGAGLGVVARDFDRDGWLDLYIANDGEDNLLWRNLGDGRFDETALQAGTAVNGRGQKEGSMGIAAADLDGDLDIDLFVTHIAEETNTLYLNDGAGSFLDSTDASGLAVASRGRTGFGVGPIDIDNDGLLDLALVNGAVRAVPGQPDPLPLRQHDQLFLNLGNARFEEISDRAPSLSEPFEVGRALVLGDLNSDGAVDLLVTNNSAQARLLLNDGARGAHWLGVRFHDFDGGLNGHGGRAVLAAGTRRLLRYASPDGSYLSASDPRAHFGLGEQASVDRLDVTWPNGLRSRYLTPPSDRYLTVSPPRGVEK